MLQIEGTGTILLTKEEFCRKTGIKPDNWIFENLSERAPFYFCMYTYKDNHPDTYHYYDGKKIYKFKHMKEYGETWMQVYDLTSEHPKWSLWNTWRVWD